jgi:hypothetical protein
MSLGEMPFFILRSRLSTLRLPCPFAINFSKSFNLEKYWYAVDSLIVLIFVMYEVTAAEEQADTYRKNIPDVVRTIHCLLTSM